MKTSIVLGLGFGDEGKGSQVHRLAKASESPLVVRFSGGHQAGHTVVTDMTSRHVFSSFGSGTFEEAPTFWSEFCTFYPTGLRREYEVLKTKFSSRIPLRYVRPTLFVHNLSPVTTPFDITYNQFVESKNHHGSVGVGVGATIARQEKFYKLYFQDLFFDSVFRGKLDNIIEFYKNILPEDWQVRKENFIRDVEWLRKQDWIQSSEKMRYSDYDHVIFEGSQGILLDQDFGFFPNVTRGNTTSVNAQYLIDLHGLPEAEIYYVTRAYQTRHGLGFMTNEDAGIDLKNTMNETNVLHTWQGNFRRSILDADLINYALKCDRNFSFRNVKNLVVTCLDQVTDSSVKLTFHNDLHEIRIPAVDYEMWSVSANRLLEFFQSKFNRVIVTANEISSLVLYDKVLS